MNLKLNMKDINKILEMTHFKCNSIFNDARKQHIFAETCLYEAVGSLPVMPSLLPHVLCGRSQFSLFFASDLIWRIYIKPSMGTQKHISRWFLFIESKTQTLPLQLFMEQSDNLYIKLPGKLAFLDKAIHSCRASWSYGS